MATRGRPSRLVILIGLTGLIELVLGLWMLSPVCLGGGAIAVCVVALSVRVVERDATTGSRSNNADSRVRHRDGDTDTSSVVPATQLAFAREAASDTESLVEEMIVSGRSVLLLRPQIIGNLDADQLERAVAELDASMSLVPSGPVLLQFNGDTLDGDERLWQADGQAAPNGPPLAGRLVIVDSLFLDRCAVTNAQFQDFVADGGYEQLAIWDEESLPALLDFVDRTGQPGPRFWTDGSCPAGETAYPVVGVSWFEARAFARWCGKRLPTDAEWTKAGAWPVESSPGCLKQRRYPWGDSFDAKRANIWGSEPSRIVAAECFDDGISIGGAYQLVGNVWEWMAVPFGDPDDVTLRLPAPMKSLRGGAFDTYFENQATCHYQSGDSPLARRHNIGFRLAISAGDLAPEATGLHHTTPDSFDQQETQDSTVYDDLSVAMLEEAI